MKKNHPEFFSISVPLLNASPGGDTGAPETSNNPVPREASITPTGSPIWRSIG